MAEQQQPASINCSSESATLEVLLAEPSDQGQHHGHLALAGILKFNGFIFETWCFISGFHWDKGALKEHREMSNMIQ